MASPPARKLPPPEYAPKLPVAPLTELDRDYKSVKDRHARLYISADFCKVVAAWSQVGAPADVDIQHPCADASALCLQRLLISGL